MANKWGSTALQILVGSLTTGSAPAALTENEILPDPDALDAISTVVQQQGRKRDRVKARLCVATMTEYRAFGTDSKKGTTRTLVIEVTETNGVYMIESIGDPEFVRHDMIFFDVTWLEV